VPAAQSAFNPTRASKILLSVLMALMLMPLLAPPCRAQERDATQMPQPKGAPAPEPGLESFQPGSTRAQWYDCGCYDQPVKHFPYSIVVFEMPQADLVTRPERREGGLTFSPLAHRYGDRYCALDSEQDCYGSFSHPCDFTDFRFGPVLAEYFPTCKSTDQEDD
jgi:hypothetical protein